MNALLENHGCIVSFIDSEDDGYSLNLSSSNIQNYTAPYEIVRKMSIDLGSWPTIGKIWES